ncbi:cadherin domain-containing protein [Microvirga arabica]|uniref:Cadherin domain-containing protein n=1 Tax=Microvirga arabica TaxID=1128671 RepID=A0ABV6Y927_9HYPH
MVASIVRLEGEQRVNTYTNSTQSSQSITALADGGWVVTWQSNGQDGGGFGVYQQRYDADGSLSGGERQVNTYTTSWQVRPSVTALKDGGWVVTWESNHQDGSLGSIHQQRYNADGSLNGAERQVNTHTTDQQDTPSVTALADGGWVVTWSSLGQDGSGFGIYQQRYNADGSLNGSEQRVNSHTINTQDEPSVTALADGSWVVTWESFLQDGSDDGIYKQRYTPVTAFGEGRESGAGSADNEVFKVRAGGLSAGDSLEAGAGTDTLTIIETGTLDLTAPDLLTGIEIVQGSSGNDVIITNATRITDIIGFQGGGGSDALHLQAGSYDLTSKFVAGIEAITLLGTGLITFADKVTALLAHSQTSDGTLILTGDSFTLAQRTQLYHQGIRSVTDADGTHILQPAVTTLSQAAVQENVAAGTTVGVLSASDPNPGDGLRFEMIDGAGGRFALSGNQLVVVNGQLLDYEQSSAHQIVVRVTDEGGISFDKTFMISIGDVPVETIRGTSGHNVLTGGAGQDRLFGGLGKDTLTGGGGQDVFVFDTKPNTKTNLDRITDFNVRDDALWLDNAIFKALGKAGSVTKPAQLKSSMFHTGSSAHDSSDRLIYNKKTGALSYDADGTGAAKQVQIATLAKKLALSHKDFFVI